MCLCFQTESLFFRVKPTPLYFMDEIDAALDFRNVSIVANYIKDRTKNAQFIIISLRCEPSLTPRSADDLTICSAVPMMIV